MKYGDRRHLCIQYIMHKISPHLVDFTWCEVKLMDIAIVNSL